MIGSVAFGAIVWAASGRGLGDTDIGTALLGIPGTIIGLGVVYAIGIRQQRLESS